MCQKLHRIYCKENPMFITELLNTPELKRLSDVGQACGVEYTKFPLFNFEYKYTRLDHSIGVAFILWNFTKDVKQTISGLLHDIASPCFAHVIDFVKNDYIKQEATEDKTFEIINNSLEIQKLLKKYNLKTEDVADYHIYPIADNLTPMLSADRLEYTLGNAYNTRIRTLNEIEEIYNDLTIAKNEFGIDEMAFSTLEKAVSFTNASIINSKFYVADEDRFSMQYLADIVKKACDKEVISEEDLYTEEGQVIRKICEDNELNKMWMEYTNLSEIEIFNKKKEDRYCVNVQAKRRYIDPLIILSGKTIRVSKVVNKTKNEIEDFLNLDFNKWMSPKVLK